MAEATAPDLFLRGIGPRTELERAQALGDRSWALPTCHQEDIWPRPRPFLGDIPATRTPAALWSGCGGREEPGKGPSPVDLGLGRRKVEGSAHGLPD